ncbi:Hypothetical protein PHPALM_13196 [Phytophthora palmivora]|uniref:Uncharacterized protein n=1 Tax=Phytophthora palmivora TaxID=4796 RepID=A0A2P4XXV0_9STRA|nr:Hypothetical protein PHPALM_13196 [Phytophthora palmivora]
MVCPPVATDASENSVPWGPPNASLCWTAPSTGPNELPPKSLDVDSSDTASAVESLPSSSVQDPSALVEALKSSDPESESNRLSRPVLPLPDDAGPLASPEADDEIEASADVAVEASVDDAVDADADADSTDGAVVTFTGSVGDVDSSDALPLSSLAADSSDAASAVESLPSSSVQDPSALVEALKSSDPESESNRLSRPVLPLPDDAGPLASPEADDEIEASADVAVEASVDDAVDADADADSTDGAVVTFTGSVGDVDSSDALPLSSLAADSSDAASAVESLPSTSVQDPSALVEALKSSDPESESNRLSRPVLPLPDDAGPLASPEADDEIEASADVAVEASVDDAVDADAEADADVLEE